MSGLKLAEILRYLATGIVVFATAYACFPDSTSKLLHDFGTIGGPIVVFVIGSIAFLMYRTLLYHLILFYILDNLNKQNVRSQLISRYNIEGKYEAEIAWRGISSNVLEKDAAVLDLPSSEVHLLYVTCVFTFVCSVFMFSFQLPSSFDTFINAIIMISLSGLSGIGALLYDYRVEKMESMVLKMTDIKKLDKHMKRIGFEIDSLKS